MKRIALMNLFNTNFNLMYSNDTNETTTPRVVTAMNNLLPLPVDWSESMVMLDERLLKGISAIFEQDKGLPIKRAAISI